MYPVMAKDMDNMFTLKKLPGWINAITSQVVVAKVLKAALPEQTSIPMKIVCYVGVHAIAGYLSTKVQENTDRLVSEFVLAIETAILDEEVTLTSVPGVPTNKED